MRLKGIPRDGDHVTCDEMASDVLGKSRYEAERALRVKEIIRDVMDIRDDEQKERLLWRTRFAPLHVCPMCQITRASSLLHCSVEHLSRMSLLDRDVEQMSGGSDVNEDRRCPTACDPPVPDY
jgi:hypothetical protein